MAGPLALRFLCIENLARWARLGKLLGRWPEERLNAQLQNMCIGDATFSVAPIFLSTQFQSVFNEWNFHGLPHLNSIRWICNRIVPA